MQPIIFCPVYCLLTLCLYLNVYMVRQKSNPQKIQILAIAYTVLA